MTSGKTTWHSRRLKIGRTVNHTVSSGEMLTVKCNKIGKGAIRVTIPKEAREGLDIVPGTEMRVTRIGDGILFEVKV